MDSQTREALFKWAARYFGLMQRRHESNFVIEYGPDGCKGAEIGGHRVGSTGLYDLGDRDPRTVVFSESGKPLAFYVPFLAGADREVAGVFIQTDFFTARNPDSTPCHELQPPDNLRDKKIQPTGLPFLVPKGFS
jgi:hypothetical protein